MPARTRLAQAGDVAALVDIHRAALPDDVLPRLGAAFLEKTFYPLLLNQADTACFVAGQGPSPEGLLVLARAPQALTAALAGCRRQLGVALLRQGWRAPGLVLDLCGVGWSKIRDLSVSAESIALASEIYLLAVHPSAQGQGLGSALVAAAFAHLTQQQTTPPLLIVKTATDAAKRFYEGKGLLPVGRERRGRRDIWLLGAPLPRAASARQPAVPSSDRGNP